jgi:chromosome segregation ATPase
VRHLSDEDLDWLTEHILKEVQQTKEAIMALADTLTELQAEDTELAADVTALGTALASNTTSLAALQTQIDALTAGGSVTAEQVAALQTVADDLAATHAAAVALVPAPPAPAA